MSKKGKRIYTALAGVLLVALYLIIFIFSAQDGETSGGISFQLSLKGVELWNDMADKGWDAQIRLYMAEYLEHPVRKLAHFLEYAAMGFLQYSLLRCHFGKKKWLFGITVLWTMLSAAADEIHQLFVPDRSGNLLDVGIDTCGGIFGVLVCMLAIAVYQKLKMNRAKRT